MMQRKVAAGIIGRQRLRGTSTVAFSQRQFSASFPATRPAMTSTGRNRLLQRATPSYQVQSRQFSTEMRAQTAAAAAANASIAAEAAGSGASKTKKAESNLFLDNLGKIFLLGIGTVIVTLIRSSYNTSNRHLIRDRLEEIAAIDPKEIEEFREANSELTIDTMRKILSIYYQEEVSSRDDSGVTSSYDDFVFAIRKIMATRFPDLGESFTIQTGHYLDRIVVAALAERGEGAPHVAEHKNKDEKLPVALFFTAMVSAMNGSVSDRIRILHELLAMEEENLKQQGGIMMEDSSNSEASKNTVPLTRIRQMVGYLQETCQLPPDTQIVQTERKYPTQLWRRATPMDMLPDLPEDGEESNRRSNGDNVDLVEFAAILRTKSVCAWGECYMKWKPDASEFESPEALPATGPPMPN